MDWSICVDPIRCAEYMAKYTAKCETISDTSSQIIKEVLNTNIQDGIMQISPLKLVKRMFMRLHGSNDYASYMVARHNLSLPLYHTSFKFENVCIYYSRKINIKQLRKFQQDKEKNNIDCQLVLFKTL